MPGVVLNYGRVRKKPNIRASFIAAVLTLIGGLFVTALLFPPRISGRSEEGKFDAAKTDLSAVAGALNRFKLDAGRYPTEAEGLHVLILRPPDNPHGPYFNGLPYDPWGTLYDYERLPDGGFRIASHGKCHSTVPEASLTIVRHGDSDSQ